jgi:hypothetical protein
MAVQTYEKGSVITLAGKWTGPLTEVFLEVRGPSSAAAVLYKLSLNQIDDDGGGDYHKDIIGDAAGPWFYRYSDENGERTIEGTFLVDENQTLIPAVTDARDVRTLIPRVRRALDGPAATSPLADASTLTDDEVTAVIADAIADILLYTGGSTVFGHTLEVVARDPFYLAPVAWRTDTELSLAEGSVVAAQAGINFFFHKLKVIKVEETITNERQTWTYKLSAQLLTNQFQMLTKARDAALEEVKVQHAVPEAYVSFLGARDASVAALIEPWINPENLNWSTSELSMPVGWHSGEIPSGFSY